MIAEVRQGDAFSVGPCYARLSSGTPINLTGAKIWSAISPSRKTAGVVTKKNAACVGGSVTQISNAADPTLGGPFWVYFGTADTAGLTAGGTYYGDIRVTLTTGEVYTVGEYELRILDPYTGVPA